MQKFISARKMHERDLEIVFRWRNHPKVRSFMLTQHEISIKEHRAWFESAEIDIKRELLAVEEDGKVIGCVIFSNVSYQGTVDWSFYADPDSPLGTGRKVCAAALDFAFNKLKVHKVSARVLDFNKASIRTHLRLGFHQEGVLREHHLINEEHLTLIVFGLLNNEWRKE
jgi:UDP-4-amino-4,6-dideoxy-N-acetyl-beta-L-altrosamine N-acetyltransferase